MAVSLGVSDAAMFLIHSKGLFTFCPARTWMKKRKCVRQIVIHPFLEKEHVPAHKCLLQWYLPPWFSFSSTTPSYPSQALILSFNSFSFVVGYMVRTSNWIGSTISQSSECDVIKLYYTEYVGATWCISPVKVMQEMNVDEFTPLYLDLVISGLWIVCGFSKSVLKKTPRDLFI